MRILYSKQFTLEEDAPTYVLGNIKKQWWTSQFCLSSIQKINNGYNIRISSIALSKDRKSNAISKGLLNHFKLTWRLYIKCLLVGIDNGL